MRHLVVADRDANGYTPEERRARDRKYFSDPVNRQRKRQRQREYYYRHRETCLDRIRKINYRLSAQEYRDMLATQGGRCAICRGESNTSMNGVPRQLAVDHDHETGRIRGLLCGFCNAGLGYFKNNPDILQSAAVYVTSSRSYTGPVTIASQLARATAVARKAQTLPLPFER